jgi:hypothetical protein
MATVATTTTTAPSQPHRRRAGRRVVSPSFDLSCRNMPGDPPRTIARHGRSNARGCLPMLKRTVISLLLAVLAAGVAACRDDSGSKPPVVGKRQAGSVPNVIGDAQGANGPVTGSDGSTEGVPVTAQPKPDESKIVRFDNGVACYLDTDDDRVEVEAKVISGQSRPLEFLVVTPSGADHEALLLMHGRAWDLKQGLELLGLREGKRKLRYRGDPDQPDGAPVDIEVHWKAADGKLRVSPIGDWVWNIKTGKPMEKSHWVFTGSLTFPDTGRIAEPLQADAVGNVIAIWRDPSCVIDNPRPSATDDQNWYPNAYANIPSAGTPVTLVFRPTTLPVPADGQTEDDKRPQGDGAKPNG